MKILHVISQRPEFTGSGVYVRSIIREAALKGYSNYLLAGVPQGSHPEIDGIPSENIRCVEFEGTDLSYPVVGMSNTMPYRSTRFVDLTEAQYNQYELAFSQKLRECVFAFRPDIIHCHHLWLVTAFTREQFPDIPIVASCHGTGIRQLSYCPKYKERVVAACNRLHHVFALSRLQARDISDIFNVESKRIKVVGGGYDQALFSMGTKSFTNDIQILFAGKLSKSKGIHWLLKSLSTLLDLPWQLRLAGSGSEESIRECHLLAERLDGRVKFHGILSQTDLAKLMRQCHVFALPSFYEGLPLVILEALASGCRIVSTSLPGTRELFRSSPSDYVKLIDLPQLETIDQPFLKDEAELENRLSLVLRQIINDSLRERDINLLKTKLILKNYTWENVFRHIDTVYQEFTA